MLDKIGIIKIEKQKDLTGKVKEYINLLGKKKKKNSRGKHSWKLSGNVKKRDEKRYTGTYKE